MDSNLYRFNYQATLTPEALPRELGYPASTELFVSSLKDERTLFLGIPHQQIINMLNEKGYDYKVVNDLNSQQDADRTIAFSMFGLGYRAESFEHLVNQFSFLSESMAMGGCVKLILRGHIPQHITNLSEQEVAKALITHTTNNRIMRLSYSTIGVYNIETIAMKFGFSKYRTRCAAEYVGKAARGWGGLNVGQQYPAYVEFLKT